MPSANSGRAARTNVIALTIAALLAAGPAQPAFADESHSFHIAAADASTAVREFAHQSGVQIMASADALKDKTLNPVAGEHTTEAALNILLADTGLRHEYVDDRGVVIAPTAQTKEARVEARPSSFWSRFRLAQTDKPSPSQGEGQGEDPEQAAGGQKVEDSAQPQRRVEIEEVVVTGTNIHGVEPIGSKVIVIDRETIDRSGHGRLQDVMATVTQNFNGVNENYLGPAGSANRTRGAEVQLRGLGVGTTLTLVNGQRQAMGGLRGAFVNISSIPVSAIERIEVLPEGASAIYGSDAIGGVVNIILRKDYAGLETRMRASTASGDAEDMQFAQLFGATWSRARVLIGYEYYERERLAAGARPYSASNDDLRRFGGSDYRQYTSNPGTILNSSTGQPTHAIPPGQDGTNLTASQLIPGGINYWDSVTFNTVLPWTRTHSAFLSSSFDFSDSWGAQFQGRYGTRDMEYMAPSSNVILNVPTSNAFNRLGSPVTVAYDFTRDLGPQIQTGTTESYFASVGVAGKLAEEWQLNVSAAYAQEREAFHARNGLSTAFAPYLASSDPAIAINPFGDGSHTSPETLNALSLNNFETGTWKTSSANVIASGPLLNAPAGAIKLALGGDFRREHYTNEPNRDVRRDVSALFGELAIPIFGPKGALHSNRLELSLAGRYEDYQDFGTTFNPKVGLDWRPWEIIKVRGTWGTSFRAPPFYLSSPAFSAIRARAQFLTDPLSTAPNRQSQVLLLSGNNPDLREETAEVWTAGFDVSSPAVEGLSFSLTYFDIDYDDKIINAGPASTILVEEARWREAITRNPTQAQIDAVCSSPGFTGACPATVAAIVDTRTRNLAGLKVSGIDSDIRYSLSTEMGQWDFGLRGTYTFDYKTQLTETAPIVEVVDTLENPLALRLSASASWNLLAWTLVATANYAGAYKNPGTIPESKIDSWTTLDLGVVYRVDGSRGWLDNTRVSLNAINVFDKEPPFVDHARNYGYDNANGDLLGRRVSAQIVKQW